MPTRLEVVETGDRNYQLPSGDELVLLVDDDPSVREVTKAILENNGYRVLTAGDGDRAVEVFYRYQGDIRLLILDVILPGKSGRQLYDTLKEAAPEVKALFMSGYAGDMVTSRGVVEGLHFLQKPARPNELLTKVREILDQE